MAVGAHHGCAPTFTGRNLDRHGRGPASRVIEWAQRSAVVAGITTRRSVSGVERRTRRTSDRALAAGPAAFGARFPRDGSGASGARNHVALARGSCRRLAHPRWQRTDTRRASAASCSPSPSRLYSGILTVRSRRDRARPRGWPRTADGILEQCVELFKCRGFAKASDIVMHSASVFGGKCYESGFLKWLCALINRHGDVGPAAILTQQAQRCWASRRSPVSPWCSAEGPGTILLASRLARAGRTDGRLYGRALR